VEPDTVLDVPGDHTVESEHMVVVAGVERPPEALGKGDRSDV